MTARIPEAGFHRSARIHQNTQSFHQNHVKVLFVVTHTHTQLGESGVSVSSPLAVFSFLWLCFRTGLTNFNRSVVIGKIVKQELQSDKEPSQQQADVSCSRNSC